MKHRTKSGIFKFGDAKPAQATYNPDTNRYEIWEYRRGGLDHRLKWWRKISPHAKSFRRREDAENYIESSPDLLPCKDG